MERIGSPTSVVEVLQLARVNYIRDRSEQRGRCAASTVAPSVYKQQANRGKLLSLFDDFDDGAFTTGFSHATLILQRSNQI